MAGSYRAIAEGWFARRLCRAVIIHRKKTESSESRKYEIKYEISRRGGCITPLLS